MFYHKFIIKEFKKLIEEEGGINEAAASIGMDPEQFFNIVDGKLSVPPQFIVGDNIDAGNNEEATETQKDVLLVCKELFALRSTLNKMGYKLHVEIEEL